MSLTLYLHVLKTTLSIWFVLDVTLYVISVYAILFYYILIDTWNVPKYPGHLRY